jgi:hypothetical protein
MLLEILLFLAVEICLVLTFLAIGEFAGRKLYLKFLEIPELAGPVARIQCIMEVLPTNGTKFQTIPYGLYWNGQNFSHSGYKQTDTGGYRNKGYEIGPKEKFRILVYGGSTTFSDFAIPDPSKCWPFQVESLFEEQDSKSIEVINAGLNYALTAELLSHFIFVGQYLKPDIVLLHGPGNDMLPIAVGDETTDYRHTRKSLQWDSRPFEKILLLKSGLARVLYCYWLRKSRFLQLEPTLWDDVKLQNQRMMDTYPHAFRSNVETLVSLCRAKAIPVVLIDFLQNNKKEIERIKPGLSLGMEEITQKMNVIFGEIARTNDHVSHIRFEHNDFPGELFVDTCHLNEEGETKKAQLIYHELRKLNLI